MYNFAWKDIAINLVSQPVTQDSKLIPSLGQSNQLISSNHQAQLVV